MTTEDGKSVGAFVMFIILFLIWALSPIMDGVAVADYNKAIAACSQHEGVRFVQRPKYISSEFTSICNNGVRVVMVTKWYEDNL